MILKLKLLACILLFFNVFSQNCLTSNNCTSCVASGCIWCTFSETCVEQENFCQASPMFFVQRHNKTIECPIFRKTCPDFESNFLKI